MPKTALTDLTLSEAASLIGKREVSPVDLTEACVKRSEALEPKVDAYITRTFESAIAEAKTAADEISAGRYRGPLHGIPFALKDLYETVGVRTTAASRIRENFVPVADARVVTLLRQAGMVLLGKLNLHEWALGATNINEYFPSVKNPWDSARMTGGSSGGSGAALAAGMCLGSLGSDTGGSIRIPASLCGITGLKPTYGRVSLRGVVPLSWSLDHAGPMARSALDCAQILQAIAGFDALDPGSVDAPVPDYTTRLSSNLNGVRVGVPRNFFFDDQAVAPEVARAVMAAVTELRLLGAQVRAVDVPDVEHAARANGVILVADAAAYHETDLKEHSDEIGSGVLARLQAGASVPGTAYALARRTQSEFKAALAGLFSDIDLLVVPSTPTAAPPLPNGDTTTTTFALTRHTGPFNLAGVPALSAPCGFTEEGLPVGMMIVGRPWEEGLVLRAAFAYQQATDWHERRPPISA